MDVQEQIELLRRQYLQLQDPATLVLPAPSLLKRPSTQESIYGSMFRDDSLVHPPPAAYRLRVLKRLVSCLERAMDDPDEDEIHDGLAETLGRLIGEPQLAPTEAAQRKAFVTYTAPRDLATPGAPSINLLESPALLAASSTTGLRTWEAALFLGSFLDSAAGRPWVAGRTVLELGAGTGFVSVLAAKHLGARFVMATDGSAQVVDGLAANVELNGLAGSGRIGTSVQQWGHMLAGNVLQPEVQSTVAGDETRSQYDLILGADVTYDGRLVPPLVATLQELLTNHPGSQGLVAATRRNEKTLKDFRIACRSAHLEVKHLATSSNAEEPLLGFFYPRTIDIELFLIGKDNVIAPAMP